MIRRLRLLSGLAMLAYVAMHLSNHAAGLVSLSAMERVLDWVMAVWGNPPAQTLLYGAFIVHYALALQALWQRQSLRLRLDETAQLVLGFALPILLVKHVVDTRIAADYFGSGAGHYDFVLWRMLVRQPMNGWLQMLILVIAWVHAMIGLHTWLRVRPGYARWQAAGLVAAVLLPVLALLGMIEAGRQVMALAAEPGWAAREIALRAAPSAADTVTLDHLSTLLAWSFAGAVVAVLAARIVRREWRRRRGLVRIMYPDGRFVDVVPGTSVLEASRLAQIPHASVCGGRGRCSTCRVRVRAAAGAIDPPIDDEARVLNRIRATRNVRLACQVRPRGLVEVTPLLPPFAPAADGLRAVDLGSGRERDVAILFADLRGFTGFAERRLPYDVVFVLNRYFAAVGRAVEAAGGRVDKFIGDGVMALFGVDGDAGPGCRQALDAARLMAVALDELNRSLQAELDRPLRIGIGIHVGPVIVGEMGYGGTVAMTAIGDAVNTADRLQNLTKDFVCQLIVSEETARRAGTDLSAYPAHDIELRGKRETLTIRTIEDASRLPEASASPTGAAAVPVNA